MNNLQINKVKKLIIIWLFHSSGVIQIQGGSNIHLGHNLTVGQTTEKPLRPEEPSINPHALESQSTSANKNKFLFSFRFFKLWKWIS